MSTRTALTMAALGTLALGAHAQTASLYAVNADNWLYQIDAGTAKATRVVKLQDDAWGLHIWSGGPVAPTGSVWVTNAKGELRLVKDLATGALDDVLFTVNGSGAPHLDGGTLDDRQTNKIEEGLVASSGPGAQDAAVTFTSFVRGPIKIIRPKVNSFDAFAVKDNAFYVLNQESGDGLTQYVYKATWEDNSKQLVGQLDSLDAAITGMVYDGNGFYGLDSLGTLYSMTLDGTPSFTKVGDTGLKDWRDMAYGAPVPEPSTMALGLLALAGWRASRRRTAGR